MIIDTFMYFDEDMILDIRLNTLNKYVSKFKEEKGKCLEEFLVELFVKQRIKKL